MVYLIKSDSYNLLNDKLSSIIEGSEEINYHSLSPKSLDTLSDVLEDVNQVRLFGNNKTIIVKDVDYFGNKGQYEEECKKLESSIKNMNSDLNLVFVCNDIKKDKKITEFIIDVGGEIINIPKPDQTTLISLIKDYVSNNNITINDSAINKIIPVVLMILRRTLMEVTTILLLKN